MMDPRVKPRVTAVGRDHSGQPVERALQDIGGGMLVDHRGALGAAGVGGEQFALDRRGGQALVPEPDRQAAQPGEIAGEGAGRLGARAFAAVHVDGQAQHQADRLALLAPAG